MNRRTTAAPACIPLWENRLLSAAVLAVAYFAMAKLGLALSFKPDFIAALWPSNGVLLAALLLSEKRHWWWLLLAMVPAELAADLPAGISWQQSLVFIGADWTEVVLAAWCVRRFLHSPTPFETLHGTLSYIVFAVLLAPFTAAFVGALVPLVGGTAGDYGASWITWFMGDALTHLTLTPALVLWCTEGLARGLKRPPTRYLESAAVSAGLLLAAGVVFGSDLLPERLMPTLVLVPLVFLLWIALRFGPKGTFTAGIAVSLVAIWTASHGLGPFTSASAQENVLHLQIFLILALVPHMLLAVIIRGQRRSEDLIQRLNTELEERVRRRTSQLELINHELESFAYAVSHDLRAPLRAINGFSQALADDFGSALEPEAQDYLQRIRKAAVRMDGLIHDMLRLSRVSRHELHGRRVDLSALARDICRELQEASPEPQVEVTIAEDLWISGDPELLRIMLFNLLHNAFKFSSNRSNPRVALSRAEGYEDPVFRLCDNGVGFPMSHAHKLFTPFQRLHSETEFAGSGIGLATVQRIVNRHHGTIWAESAPDEGACFFFSFDLSDG